jgi:hypothetical protein
MEATAVNSSKSALNDSVRLPERTNDVFNDFMIASLS